MSAGIRYGAALPYFFQDPSECQNSATVCFLDYQMIGNAVPGLEMLSFFS